MRQMMFNVVHLATELLLGKARCKQIRDALTCVPVLEAVEHKSDIGALCHQIGQLSKEIGAAVLVDRGMLNIRESKACFPQTIGDRLAREAGPMLYAAEPLLFYSRDELAVADECSRGIAVEGVEAEDDHRVNLRQLKSGKAQPSWLRGPQHRHLPRSC